MGIVADNNSLSAGEPEVVRSWGSLAGQPEELACLENSRSERDTVSTKQNNNKTTRWTEPKALKRPPRTNTYIHTSEKKPLVAPP